jgi:hypothetical protein
VQPLLIKLNERLNGQGRTDGEVLGEMDDLTMILAPDAVGATAEFLNVGSAKLGLQLNFSKCELMSMEGLEALVTVTAPTGIDRVSWCKNRGIPIGPDNHCGKYWDKFLDGIVRETDIVYGWSNVQAALVLFRMCISTKLNYIHRSVPPSSSYVTPLVHRATAIMRGGLARILGLQDSLAAETASWWLQGTLPPLMGGFGIMDPSLIHHVSFLACEAAVSDSISALQSARNLEPFQPSDDAQRTFASHCVDKDLFPDLSTLFLESYKLQHRLSVELYKKRPAIGTRMDSSRRGRC